MGDAFPIIGSLDEIAAGYRVLFCDVWGVVHNGVRAYPDAVAALMRARDRGQAVVLLTNSPRLRDDVGRQLAALGVDAGCYDRIVTSGDVTRKLAVDGPRRVFHLGPERDLGFFEGLDLELVEAFEAAGVICTGLVDDETETPEDYAQMLRRFRSRDLPMLCANPDIVVERGDRLLWCAGALARDYSLLGGRVAIAGKPHRPIYDAALEEARAVAGETVDRTDILAIGDGVMTDVKGAMDFGCDLLFVTEGVHAAEYSGRQGPDPGRLAAFLEGHGMRPVAAIARLK